MDYFTDLLAMFLDVDWVNYIAVYGRVRELSESIKNILICVPNMNGGHFHFCVNYPISCSKKKKKKEQYSKIKYVMRLKSYHLTFLNGVIFLVNNEQCMAFALIWLITPCSLNQKVKWWNVKDNECSEFTAVSVNGLKMMTAVSGNKSMKP